MPNYEYECKDCGTNYEDSKLIAERDNSTCSNCKSTNTKRLPAAPPFHLQGVGWSKHKKKAPRPSVERMVEDLSRKPKAGAE